MPFVLIYCECMSRCVGLSVCACFPCSSLIYAREHNVKGNLQSEERSTNENEYKGCIKVCIYVCI